VRFEKDIEVLNSQESVWRFLWDVDRFIGCVPGCKGASIEEEGKSYSALLVEKVGPFRVEFPMRIEVLERKENSYIKARATGNDAKVGSRMKVDLEVHLSGDEEKSTLSLVASVDILGKLAALGHGLIKRRADQVMQEFSVALKKRLEESS
jgi:carbon monoxide dehydrogenase subunit G